MARIRTNTPWRQSIIEVLEDNGSPMHYREIARQIKNKELRYCLGNTPETTVNVYITQSIRKYKDNSPFEKVQIGTYRLNNNNLQSQTSTTNFSQIIHAFGKDWDRSKVYWDGASTKILGGKYDLFENSDFSGHCGIFLLQKGHEVIHIGNAGDTTLGECLYLKTIDDLKDKWDKFSWFSFGNMVEREDVVLGREYNVPLYDLLHTFMAVMLNVTQLNTASVHDFHHIKYNQFYRNDRETQSLNRN